MIFEKIFLDGIYSLAGVSFTPDTVVDCGACAGFFTVLAHGRWPATCYHVFEPNPANLTRLRSNLALNAIAATVHAAAVGDQAGTAGFSGDGFGGHLADSNGPQTIAVTVADLTLFLRDIHPQRLVLKMDIEGAEATLLPKLPPVLPSATVVFLETHHPEPIWRQYLQPLLAVGFDHCLTRHRYDKEASTDYVEHLLTRR